MADVHTVHTVFDALNNRPRPELAEVIQGGIAQRIPFEGKKSGGKHPNVKPLVAPLRVNNRLTEKFKVAGANALTEFVHLLTSIVEVIFAGDAVPLCLQQIGKGIPQNTTPNTVDAEGSGGVGADILYLGGFSRPVAGGEGAFARSQKVIDLGSHPHLGEPKINKPRWGNLCRADEFGRREVGDDDRGNL